MIFDRYANLKYKYGNRHFWCRGYFADTVGENKNAYELMLLQQQLEKIMRKKKFSKLVIAF